MTPPDDPKKPRPGSVVEVPPRRAATQGDRQRDAYREKHRSSPHGVPVTTFPAPPMPPPEPAFESWESSTDSYTPVSEPPSRDATPAQRLAVIDKNARKAAGVSINTLQLIEELRKINAELVEQNRSIQAMLSDVIEEKRRAQGVIEQMAIANHGSFMKSADLSRTITAKAAAVLITAVSALVGAFVYWSQNQ